MLAENMSSERQPELALKEKDLGNQKYKLRQFDEAIHHYTNAYKLDDNNVLFLTNRAAVYFEQGEYDKCIEDCQVAADRGRELHADYKIVAKAYSRMGSAYEKKSDLTSAIKYYQKSLSEHRNPEILQKLKQSEKEKKKLEEQSYIDPSKADEEREKANQLFKSGQYADAIKGYTEAIKRNPADVRHFSNRAACYTKLCAYQDAIKDCEAAINLDPNFVKAYIRKGVALQAMKETPRALSAFQEAMDHDSTGQHRNEIENNIKNCYLSSSSQESNESQEETVNRAMQDPEVASILSDPVMMNMLKQGQEDPKALMEHMRNPEFARKVRKLMASGIVKAGF